MKFWLGTWQHAWLQQTDVPLFVSRSALKKIVSKHPGRGFYRARGPWALDSGGFIEIGMNGRWTVTAEEYAREVRFWQREIGNMEWAAPQDWMCEPPVLIRAMIEEGIMELGDYLVDPAVKIAKGKEVKIKVKSIIRKKTGARSRLFDKIIDLYGASGERFANEPLLRQRVCVHQQRTIDNYLALKELAPEVPWIPVLQGWTPEDYIAHTLAYARAGIDLWEQPLVGLGSVCRRELLADAKVVIRELTAGDQPMRLHGFGLKRTAFHDPEVAGRIVSTDSQAWSREARWKAPEVICCVDIPHEGISGCTNCIHWALVWRKSTIDIWKKAMREEHGRPRRETANPAWST